MKFIIIFLLNILAVMTRSTRSNSKPVQKQQNVNKNNLKRAETTKSKSQQKKKIVQPTKKVKQSKLKSCKSKQSQKEPVKKESVKKNQGDKINAKQPMKKIVMKGNIPVDTHFSKSSSYRVLISNGINYSTTLNQSNIQNNNNKFYILQILQSESNPNSNYFFTRWGRVGVVGQMAEMGPFDEAFAIRQYRKKLNDKIRGNYRQVEMNYEQNNKSQEEEDKGQKKNEPETKSDLPIRVQDLVRTIFDMKMVNNAMKEIGYDAKKMPLGKLAKSSIIKGYEALKILMDEVKGRKNTEVINQASSDFYSYIPHDFGFTHMSIHVLNTEKKIKEKLQMLQSLEDIQVFTKILDQGKISSDMNQLDSNYLKLNTQITPLDPKSQVYQKLIKYVENTHASTHTAYKLHVQDIFILNKETENTRYTKDINNKQLLWHGSRLTNYVGILSQGLRIAPPQAPVTGYMFGKGVYFADMVTKSANYCFTNKSQPTGLMILCQVALGGMNEKQYADYYANLLPEGKHSTKGVGKTGPKNGEMLGDVWIPNGVGQPLNVLNTSLLYNQYIVYDVAQIKCKYLFKMKFMWR